MLTPPRRVPARARPTATLLAAALACAGCGGGDGTSSSSGGFTLGVDSIGYRRTINGVSPSSGDRFLLVNLALRNENLSTPIGSNPLYFSATLDTRLVVNASSLSSQLTSPCRTDLSAASGGSIYCSVAFELSGSDTGSVLNYNDQQGHTATAPIPAVVAMHTLAGRWQSDIRGVATELDIRDDGTADMTYTGTGGGLNCLGGMSYTRLMWSTTDTVITLSGHPSCSGQLDCGGFEPITCSNNPMTFPDDCDYTLSADGTSLSITGCRNGTGFYTGAYDRL